MSNRNYPKTDLLLSEGVELPPVTDRTLAPRLRTFRLVYFASPSEDVITLSAAHAVQARQADELPHTIMDLSLMDAWYAALAR